MNEQYAALANRALELQARKDRVLIALAGMPGSGKTTTATAVAQILGQCSILATVISMDGFHYTRAYLDSFPNKEEAHARRGAPFTFDSKRIVEFVRSLSDGTRREIKAPTFDHAIKDPVEDGLIVNADTEIIILEGNYMLLNTEPWNEIAKLVDEKWIVDVDPAIARERLAKRHLEAGIVDSYEAGLQRADNNDLPNGELILQHLCEPEVRIKSIPKSTSQ